jgi:hypothetical protein
MLSTQRRVTSPAFVEGELLSDEHTKGKEEMEAHNI